MENGDVKISGDVIKYLYEKGFKQKDIARLYNCTVQYVCNTLRTVKDDELKKLIKKRRAANLYANRWGSKNQVPIY